MPEEMVIFTRTYDLITWLMPLTLNFPRTSVLSLPAACRMRS